VSGEETDRNLAVQLVERSPNGVLVTAPDGRIRMLNPAVREMLPVVPDAVGRVVIEAIPMPPLAEALAPSRDDEVEFAVRSGRRDLLIRVVPLGPADGRLAILQDVTSLRRAEQYRREFVANVSHELRTPATAIVGYAETLLEERASLDPVVAEMVEVIQRNARRLSDLFEDLLRLARLDAQEGPLPLEPLSLLPLVTEAIEKLRVHAHARTISFQVEVPAELRARVNREAVGQVILNLVGNAIKYSYDGGLVSVVGRWREGRVVLEVIDLGIGIDPIHHERIFERFYRTDKGRSRDAGGTGLGLAICKRLCDAMGAGIEVKSRPGRGSLFRVVLQPPE
jgi:two-component system, OmpR family, phosphate regulon sensor histidine kinase PhoR